MSGSSPGDLAVAFRSLHRRLEQALEPVGGERALGGGEVSTLDKVISDAAGILGVRADPEAIAHELTERPADAWRDGELDRLRDLALSAGRSLRTIEDHARGAADQ